MKNLRNRAGNWSAKKKSYRKENEEKKKNFRSEEKTLKKLKLKDIFEISELIGRARVQCADKFGIVSSVLLLLLICLCKKYKKPTEEAKLKLKLKTHKKAY